MGNGPIIPMRVVECDREAEDQPLHAAIDNGVSNITLCGKRFSNPTSISIYTWATGERQWCPECQMQLRGNGHSHLPVVKARPKRHQHRRNGGRL